MAFIAGAGVANSILANLRKNVKETNPDSLKSYANFCKIVRSLTRSRSFTERNAGGYFVGLLRMSHLGNAFFSSSICALVRAGLSMRSSSVNRVSFFNPFTSVS